MNLVSANDQLVNIAQICRGCPTATLRRAFVRALREWAQQTMWLTTNVQGTLVTGQQQYTLGNDPDLDIVALKGMQGTLAQPTGNQYFFLTPSDPTTWDPNMQPGIPGRYAYVPQAQFAVAPIPNQDIPVLITIAVQPKEGAVNIPADPLIKYSNEIESGALAYLYQLPGQPWSNPNLALVEAKRFSAGIANGKSDVQRKFNTGTQRARPRPILFR